MTLMQPSETAMTGPNILLATDLSARCDRALDRAVQLATERSAKLVVAHAIAPVLVAPEDQLSGRHHADPLEASRRRARADMRRYEQVEVEILIEQADPAELILATLERIPCDLIVTGMARDEAVGRVNLGATVNTLVHATDVPVLVVKSRPWNNYERIIVATDFSEGSRAALEAAAVLFPQAQITLFHAFDVVYEAFVDDKAAARAATHRKAMEKSRAFIAAAGLDDAVKARIIPVCDYGYAGTLLSDLALADEVDLVVLGTASRSGLAGFLLGSTGQRLATELSVDVMLVRQRRGQ